MTQKYNSGRTRSLVKNQLKSLHNDFFSGWHPGLHYNHLDFQEIDLVGKCDNDVF